MPIVCGGGGGAGVDVEAAWSCAWARRSTATAIEPRRERSGGDRRRKCPWCAAEAGEATRVVGASTAAERPFAHEEDSWRCAFLYISPVGSALMAGEMPLAPVFCFKGKKAVVS